MLCDENLGGLGDPVSQSSHSSLSPHSFASPASNDVLAANEQDRVAMINSHDGDSPGSVTNFSSQNAENCRLATTAAELSSKSMNRNRLHYGVQKTYSYQSNEDVVSDKIQSKPYGMQDGSSVFLGTILEGFNAKNFDNHSALSFVQPATNRSHSGLPISSIDCTTRADYVTKSGIYGTLNDSSMYHANAQSFGGVGIKNNGSYPIQGNSFYQANHQPSYNPFASSSYSSQTSCDYGNTFSGLGHHTGNLAGNRPYGYVGTTDLWNGTGSTIGYDAPGVAAAAAATGVAAAAAAAAAISNYPSSYMAGIATSPYGECLVGQNYLEREY